MAEPMRWGILGTGNIARQFAAGLTGSERGKAVAVGSRSADSASAFARSQGMAGAFGSYDELLADRTVEAVYVSLPNSMHHEWTLKALRAGKHVLCEKPFAADAAQAQEMFDAARNAGRVVMEAFMYRSHPQTHALLRLVREGTIGQVRLIRTSFCYRTSKIAGNIRFDRALAGGALMDIGCYCVSLSRLVAGAEPTAIHAVGGLHGSGVDEMAAGTLTFPGGVLASFSFGMSVQADNAAQVCGTDGYVIVPVPWKPPTEGAELIVGRSTPPRMDHVGKPVPAPPPREVVRVDAGKPLYGLEADDFAAAVRDGKPPVVSEADTMGNMRVLDEIRRQLGVVF